MPKGFMMRPIAKIVAITCLIAGPVLAQTATPNPGDAMPTVPPGPASGMANPPSSMDSAPATNNDATAVPARPSNWTGTDADWAAHVRKCQKRDGYNPATDQYRTPSGAMRTCPR